MATEAVALPNRTTTLPALLPAFKTGLGVGVFTLVVCLIGLVNAFAARFIIANVITSAQAILLVLFAIAGYIAARASNKRKESVGGAIICGLVAGLGVGLVLALFTAVAAPANFRSVLVNAAPPLFNILTFNNTDNLVLGLPLLLIASTVGGFLGGFLYVMPSRLSNAILAGVTGVVIIGLIQDISSLIVRTGISRDAERFMFARSGLTTAGALIVFLLPFLYSLGSSYFGTQVRERYEALPFASRRILRYVAYGIGIVLILIFPRVFGRFPAEVANNVALLGILMGLGLNIVVGFAGMLDLGYVGFFAIGAYTMGVLTSPEMGGTLNFWMALPISILVSLAAGVILGVPVLKMRGDYLAIVTLGFGEIIRLLFLSDWLKQYVNGAQGITRIPNIQIGATALNTPENLYYFIVVAVALTWFISIRLRDSRLGRAWMAIREDEDVAEAMGIDLVATKLLAFGTGATMAGFGGAIFASKLQSIVPQTFDLLISINALAVIIIGGLGSIPGVFIGALLLIGVPELLREFAEYRLWAYGVLLVLMMLFRPEGFVPSRVARRELHLHDQDNLE